MSDTLIQLQAATKKRGVVGAPVGYIENRKTQSNTVLPYFFCHLFHTCACLMCHWRFTRWMRWQRIDCKGTFTVKVWK